LECAERLKGVGESREKQAREKGKQAREKGKRAK